LTITLRNDCITHALSAGLAEIDGLRHGKVKGMDDGKEVGG
jgi:hypothetical protein